MTTRPAIFKWRQSEPRLILCAVRWYLRYSLSLRDVEELLEERCLEAGHHRVALGAALRSGTRSALEAAASGVRINLIAPGPIDTGMLDRFAGTPEQKASLAATVPLNRVGRPEEIAQTIMFLASDKASFITGASYVIEVARRQDDSLGGTVALRSGCTVPLKPSAVEVAFKRRLKT